MNAISQIFFQCLLAARHVLEAEHRDYELGGAGQAVWRGQKGPGRTPPLMTVYECLANHL